MKENIIKKLLNIQKELERVLQILVNSHIEIDGSLNISKRKNKNLEYFYYNNGKQTYIPREKINLIKNLAQKSYNKKLEKLVKRRLYHIKELNKSFKNNDIEQIYNNLNPELKQLVSPIIPNKNQLIETWKNTPFISNDYEKSHKTFKTKNGDYVRSKSEKILADMFYDKKIQYKYECQLVLNRELFYPDFTFFNPQTKQEIYWEHFGMMDNPHYAEKAISKIIFYHKNGIALGDSLIATFETSSKPIDLGYVEMVVDMYLIE